MHEINPQNADFDDLTFDRDGRFIAGQKIYHTSGTRPYSHSQATLSVPISGE